MVSSRTLLFVCLMFNILVILVSAQKSFLYEYCEKEKGNFTTNSTYQSNLKQVLSIIPYNGSRNGFYPVSYGQNSDEVYAIGLWQGDVEPHICRSCLNQSTQLLTQTCLNLKEAIGWLDECRLRYSNRSLIGLMETHPNFHSWSTQNSSFIDMDSFSQDVKTLLENLKNGAAAGGSLRKYASGNASVHDQFQNLYAFAKRGSDLSDLDCNNCLDASPAAPPSPPPLLQTNTAATQDQNPRRSWSTSLREEAEQQRESGERRRAFLRYRKRESSWQEMQDDGRRFLILEGKKRNKFRPGFVVVPIALIIFIGIHTRMKKANKRGENLPSSEAAEEIKCAKHLQFDFSAIRFSTNNFSKENKIGQSMVGLVYRGRLHDGQKISVKRFYEHDSCREQFKNEIKLSSKFQHRNIVKLLGFCLEGSEMLLVYEFVLMSLDLLIFDPLKFKHKYLDWDKRSNIIRGIARGLLYLHEDSGLKIVHRDITTSNVLLDEELNPKILGFGRAKVFGEVDQNEGASVSPHASTSLTGYGAPEFFQGGAVISEKADVFSFGVLVLEIVTGQRSCEPLCHGNPDEEPTLIGTVWRNWIEGTVFDLVDPKIKDGKESEIMRCIHIGLLCVQENKDARPTMNSVVLMLCCYSFPLPVPSQPGYFREISRNELNGTSSSDLNSGVSASSYDNFVTRLGKKILCCFAAKGGKSTS